MLNKMKEMYSKINYNMYIVIADGMEVGLLYFGKRKSSPDMVILEQEDCSNESIIKDTVNLLYKIGKEANCNKFHIVTSIKPDVNILKDLAFLNIKVSDHNDIERINNAITEGNHIELLPHNEYTLNEAESLLGKHRKVAIIQATGTGKSFILGRFLANKNYGRKLVITPSRHIINQIQRYFDEILNDDICFLTYSKLSSMSDEELESLTLDTLILDEFHRAGASKWEESVRKLINLNKKAYFIGTTATPRRYLDNDRNMVEELFDGISTEEIDVSSSIVRGILPNPKYIYSIFDFGSEIDKAIKLVEEGRYKNEEEGLREEWISSLNKFKLNWNNSKGLDDVVENYLKKDGKNKFIVFCSNKSHIEEMQKEFKKCFNKNGFILENEEVIYTGLYNNEKTLSRFENYKIKESNGVSLLFCIDMLSEGVHLKSKQNGTDLRGVFLMRNTISPIIFYQQIGRALSSNMNEVPMIFDLTNNCASIKTKFYQYDLEEKEVVLNRIRNKFGMKPINYTSSIDIRCVDILTLLSTIKSKFEVSWDNRINDLKEFVEKHGHAAISKSNADADLVLWAQNTRSRYFRNELSREYVEILNSLGFVWDLSAYKWDIKLKGLEKFQDKDGFITSITKDMSEEYSNLASSLRTSYRKGVLSEDKISALEKIGFVWEMEEHRWSIMYNELLEYNKQRREAELNFKMSKPQSSKLKNWISVQRSKYDRGALSEEKIHLLKKAEVSFLLEKDSWMESYNKYLLGMSKPKNERPDFVYTWASKQRTLYSEGKLTEEQIALITKQGINLLKADDIFWNHFNELVKYKKEYGNCRVLKKNTTNKRFYSWYSNLKMSFDKLSEDKKEALLSLGYERYTRHSTWNANLEMYREIKNKPYTKLSKEELRVYRWACGVKRRYKKGILGEEKIEAVKELVLV